MLSFCLKCRKNTESKNPKVVKTENRRMFLSKCKMCDKKKTKFLKEQDTNGLLSILGIKIQLSKIPLVGLLISCINKLM